MQFESNDNSSQSNGIIVIFQSKSKLWKKRCLDSMMLLMRMVVGDDASFLFSFWWSIFGFGWIGFVFGVCSQTMPIRFLSIVPN